MRNLWMALALVGGGFIVSGCGAGPCDRLQDLCNKCSGTTKTSCDTTVSTYKSIPTGDASCQAVLDAKTYDSCN